jgi:hypothetical protein
MVVVLMGRKVPGTPYGGTYQPRRSTYHGRGLLDLWRCWRYERKHREFDRWRLVWRRGPG